jgi:hypothetical protein
MKKKRNEGKKGGNGERKKNQGRNTGEEKQMKTK